MNNLGNSTFLARAEKAAREELEGEAFKEAVEKAKARIREQRARPWYVKLFPYKLVRR